MPRSNDIFQSTLEDHRARGGARGVLITMFVCVTLIGTLFVGGEFFQRMNYYQEQREGIPYAEPVTVRDIIVDMALNTIPEMPLPWMDRRLLESGLRVYDLRIQEGDLAYLQRDAEHITAVSDSREIEHEYVDAEFLKDGEWVPVKVKLRGQTASHFHKRIMSLRVNFRKEELFEGKEQINISFMYDKGLTSDVTANQELARHGIMTWHSDFVVLRINGELIGMFQEIEQFGRSISDRHRRAEGFIFAGHGQAFDDPALGYDKALEALELLTPCEVEYGETPPEHCNWELFEDYLDVDKWAWAAAMTMLVNSTHAWSGENMRMFWDPARGRFEPIPWDYLYYPIPPQHRPMAEPPTWDYRTALFGSPEFRRERDRRVWTLLTERLDPMIESADALFDALSTPLSYDLRHFGVETDREMHEEYTAQLRENREIIMDAFRRHELHASAWHAEGEPLVVAVENHGKAFVEIGALELETPRGKILQRLAEPVIVDGLWWDGPGRRVFDVDVPAGARLVTLRASNEVTGAELAREEIAVQHGMGAPPPVPVEPAPPAPPLDGVEGVVTDARTISLGPGRVAIEESVTIPRRFDVVFRPGLDLRLADDVSLVIHGNLDSVGTPSAPITIGGLTSQESWGGVFVQGKREQPSRVNIEFTTVVGGKGGQSRRSFFTSPFSIHDGIVRMTHSEFTGAAADDGINVKYVDVDIRDNVFSHSFSDSVDCDFCTGTLAFNQVHNSGGDGLDFSGSNVLLESNRIDRCADKGVSIGEGTDAIVNGTIVNDCYMGMGVKDSSDAEISGGEWSNVEVGLAMYIKKLTFGPPRAKIRDVSMNGVLTRYLHDGSGDLTIVDPTPEDVVVSEGLDAIRLE